MARAGYCFKTRPGSYAGARCDFKTGEDAHLTVYVRRGEQNFDQAGPAENVEERYDHGPWMDMAAKYEKRTIQRSTIRQKDIIAGDTIERTNSIKAEGQAEFFARNPEMHRLYCEKQNIPYLEIAS